MRGQVKFFNSQKGYGFIIPDDRSELGDAEGILRFIPFNPAYSRLLIVFVHHTAIFNDGGFKSLAEGEMVEFDLLHGPKGYQAAHVTGPGGSSVKGDPMAGKQGAMNMHGMGPGMPGMMPMGMLPYGMLHRF